MRRHLCAWWVLLCTACAPNGGADTVTVSGRVTDFDGRPIEHVTVAWLSPSFDGHYFTLTDADGRYCARIPKGRYASAGGLDMAQYPIAGSTLPEADQRLEYWHWNFLAERDTTFDFRYHRLEIYGVNAFQVQGAAPGYTIYFRPMSLTRWQQWVHAGRPDGDNALAPPIDSARIEVTIDSEPVAVRMAQQVREYFDERNWSGAYLLFVDRPRSKRPVRTFRIVMEDLGTGDKGEGALTLEELPEKYIRPRGEIDATYKE